MQQDDVKVSSDSVDKSLVVTRLFQAWEESEIHYVVPRNYTNLPEKTGKDLDILVAADQVRVFEQLVARVLSESGWVAVTNRDDWRGVSINAYPSNETPFISLGIDLRAYISIETSPIQKAIPGLSRKLFANQVERIRILPDGACPVYVPAAKDEWILLYRQSAMKSKPEYVERLRELAKEKTGLATWLQTSSGVSVDDLIQALDKDEWMAHAGQLLENRLGNRQGKFAIVSETIRAALIMWSNRVRLAPVIYFSGPDGAGKTTAVKLVSDWMDCNGLQYRSYYSLKIVLRRITRQLIWLKKRGKHGARPNQGTSLRKIKPPSEDERDRDDGTRYWRFRKHAALVVGVLDMYIGALFVLKDRVFGKVVLVETSPLDIFVKYHMPEYPLTERILCRTLLKPNLGLLLRASPTKIVERKPELSQSEIEDYYTRIDKLLKRSRMRERYVCVDSSAGLDEMKEELSMKLSQLVY